MPGLVRGRELWNKLTKILPAKMDFDYTGEMIRFLNLSQKSPLLEGEGI